MSTIPGLSSALKSYDSDKPTERSRGLVELREIFSNRENVDQFNKGASKHGGEGWVSFFQCLFQAVSLDKKAAIKEAISNDKKTAAQKPTKTCKLGRLKHN